MQQSLLLQPLFKMFVDMFFFFMVYRREDTVGVFILEFRTLIAVGCIFLKSSSLASRICLISTCQQGPVMQRGWDLCIRGKEKT